MVSRSDTTWWSQFSHSAFVGLLGIKLLARLARTCTCLSTATKFQNSLFFSVLSLDRYISKLLRHRTPEYKEAVLSHWGQYMTGFFVVVGSGVVCVCMTFLNEHTAGYSSATAAEMLHNKACPNSVAEIANASGFWNNYTLQLG